MVSLIGLPIGIILKLPAVWVLATLGIVIGGIKLRRETLPHVKVHAKQTPFDRSHVVVLLIT